MTALHAIAPTTAQPEAAAALAEAKAAFGGTVPTLPRVMADSPSTLRGYLAFSQALSDGGLAPDVSERIALLVAEQNGCAYCLSAHTYVVERELQLPAEEITAAREGDSSHPRIRALLQLASAVNSGRGEVPDDVIERARAAGVSDSEIVDVIGHVAVNAFSNYFAKAARVGIDFPPVALRGSAA
jgi:uncharacterized peroxidase-related enzyme